MTEEGTGSHYRCVVPRVRAPRDHQETRDDAEAKSLLLFQHPETDHPTQRQDGCDLEKEVGASFKPY